MPRMSSSRSTAPFSHDATIRRRSPGWSGTAEPPAAPGRPLRPGRRPHSTNVRRQAFSQKPQRVASLRVARNATRAAASSPMNGVDRSRAP